VVSTLHDLQFHHYPSFFSEADRAERAQHFQLTCRSAARIAAVSEFSRGSALDHGGLDAGRIRTIPTEIGLSPSAGVSEQPPFGLGARRYLLYPANLWAHKNHELLLTAFAMARAQGLDADLKLVCTGDGVGRLEFLRSVLPTLGLEGSVLFPGFVSDSKLERLRAHALALIFPSLYEGFGMPIIEAMARGLPVACSQTTATGEVAADAALTFQPGHPGAVAEAILRLVGDAALRQELSQRGLLRAGAFGDPGRMADRYWALFNEAFRSCASA
jgi:glycosyltransferase involved in cell wall biosynthesis